MLSDWELWAVASTVIDQHGKDAPLFVARRIGALARAGDEAGIGVWEEIDRRIVRLSERPGALDA